MILGPGLCFSSCTFIWKLQHKNVLMNLFQNCPPPPTKTLNLASNCHFVSSWKSIYWKKYWLKELVCFWWRNQDCVSIATELCEEFKRRVLLSIFYRISPHLFPWKWPILWYTAILFLHGKAFTKRGVQFLMVRLGLCVDCCRIMWGIQLKGSLKHFLQNFSSPLLVKTANFM